jgi:hypothetical protein
MGGATHVPAECVHAVDREKFISINMERYSGAYISEVAPTILGKSVNKRIQQPSERLMKAKYVG